MAILLVVLMKAETKHARGPFLGFALCGHVFMLPSAASLLEPSVDGPVLLGRKDAWSPKQRNIRRTPGRGAFLVMDCGSASTAVLIIDRHHKSAEPANFWTAGVHDHMA